MRRTPHVAAVPSGSLRRWHGTVTHGASGQWSVRASRPQLECESCAERCRAVQRRARPGRLTAVRLAGAHDELAAAQSRISRVAGTFSNRPRPSSTWQRRTQRAGLRLEPRSHGTLGRRRAIGRRSTWLAGWGTMTEANLEPTRLPCSPASKPGTPARDQPCEPGCVASFFFPLFFSGRPLAKLAPRRRHPPPFARRALPRLNSIVPCRRRAWLPCPTAGCPCRPRWPPCRRAGKRPGTGGTAQARGPKGWAARSMLFIKPSSTGPPKLGAWPTGFVPNLFLKEMLGSSG